MRKKQAASPAVGDRRHIHPETSLIGAGTSAPIIGTGARSSARAIRRPRPTVSELEAALGATLDATMATAEPTHEPPGRGGAELAPCISLHHAAVLLAERLDLDALEDLVTRVAGVRHAPGHGGRRYVTLSSAFEGLVAADGAAWVG